MSLILLGGAIGLWISNKVSTGAEMVRNKFNQIHDNVVEIYNKQQLKKLEAEKQKERDLREKKVAIIKSKYNIN